MRAHKQSLANLPDRTLALLSEITASTAKHNSGDDEEAILFRLLADPLLLRQHLNGKGGVHPDRDGLTHRLSHNLQSRMFLSTAVSGSDRQVLDHRYRPVEPQPAESLRPEPFAATHADMTLALDNCAGLPGESPTPQVNSEVVVSTVVISTCLQILMAVLAIVVVADALLG